MPQSYCFEFPGTREMFLDVLNQYPNNDNKHFYFNDYIVEIRGENYRFGVARGGHSGGYWFEPTITEADGKLLFTGQIEYIDYYSVDKDYKKAINKIEECFLLVILLPLLLLVKLFTLLSSAIKKIRRQPEVKAETTEDRLFNLMEKQLGCNFRSI